jgi:hypothetical protein
LKSIEIISKEVKNHLQGKHILTVSGQSDFDCLGPFLADFEVFEFHNFWKKWTGENFKKESKNGVPTDKSHAPVLPLLLQNNTKRRTFSN